MNKKELIDATYKVLRHWEDNVVASATCRFFDYDKYGGACEYCNIYSDMTSGCKICPVGYDRQPLGGGCGSELGNSTWKCASFGRLQSNWDEFQYLLNVAYSQGLESKYMEEL